MVEERLGGVELEAALLPVTEVVLVLLLLGHRFGCAVLGAANGSEGVSACDRLSRDVRWRRGHEAATGRRDLQRGRGGRRVSLQDTLEMPNTLPRATHSSGDPRNRRRRSLAAPALPSSEMAASAGDRTRRVSRAKRTRVQGALASAQSQAARGRRSGGVLAPERRRAKRCGLAGQRGSASVSLTHGVTLCARRCWSSPVVRCVRSRRGRGRGRGPEDLDEQRTRDSGGALGKSAHGARRPCRLPQREGTPPSAKLSLALIDTALLYENKSRQYSVGACS
jgi:hypothetical protein